MFMTLVSFGCVVEGQLDLDPYSQIFAPSPVQNASISDQGYISSSNFTSILQFAIGFVSIGFAISADARDGCLRSNGSISNRARMTSNKRFTTRHTKHCKMI